MQKAKENKMYTACNWWHPLQQMFLPMHVQQPKMRHSYETQLAEKGQHQYGIKQWELGIRWTGCLEHYKDMIPYLSKIMYIRWECIPQNPLVRPSLEIKGHLKQMDWDGALRWWLQILFRSLAIWFWRKYIIFVCQRWNTQTLSLCWFIILRSFLIRNHLQQHPNMSLTANTNERFVEWSIKLQQ